MASCEHCGDSIYTLTYECNYCSQSFCRSHRLPETHDCSHVSDARPPASKGSSDQLHDTDSTSEIDFRDENVDLQELRERAKAEAEGEPYSVAEVQHTVGTTPDSNFDSSPDVAIDGSIKQNDTQNKFSMHEQSNSTGVLNRKTGAVLAILLASILLYVLFLM